MNTIADAKHQISHAYGTGPGYFCISRVRHEHGTKNQVAKSWRDAYYEYPRELDRAVRDAFRWDAQGFDVYFGAHRLKNKGTRKKANAAGIVAAFGDLDAGVQATGVPPSAVWTTSPGHAQGLWRLDEPDGVSVAVAETLNKRIAIEHGADPSGVDVSQVLRLVGTHNWTRPETPLVTLDYVHETAAYTVATLDAALPPLETPCHAVAPRRAHTQEPSGDRAGDDFNQRADWGDILGRNGWTFVYEQNGEGYWCRPGKRGAVSATTNYQGSGLLHVFTSSTAFEPEGNYSKFGALAVLEYSGDFAAAARALRAQGYGRQLAAEPAPTLTPDDLAAEYERLRAAYVALQDQHAAAVEDRDRQRERADREHELRLAAEAKAQAHGRMLDAIGQHIADPDNGPEVRLLVGLELAHYRRDPALDMIGLNHWRLTQKLARSLCGVRSVATAGKYARRLAEYGLLPLGEPETVMFTKPDGTKVDAEILTYFYDPPAAKPDRPPEEVVSDNRPILLARERRLKAKRDARGSVERFNGCPNGEHKGWYRACAECGTRIPPKTPDVRKTAPAPRPDQSLKTTHRSSFAAKADRQPPCPHGVQRGPGVFCIECDGRQCENCSRRRPGNRKRVCAECRSAIAVEFSAATGAGGGD